METVAELSERLIEQQMLVKEDMIKNLYKDQEVLDKNDLSSLTYIQFLRGWEAVAFAAIQPDRDDMLGLVVNGAHSFSADQVGVVFEGWAARTEKNPATGDDWERGDMQHLAQENGLKEGLVGEALIVHAIDREGNFSMRIRHFEMRDKEVVWLRDQDMDIDTNTEDGNGSGLVVDAMKFAMSVPTLKQTVSGEATLNEDETEEELEARRAKYLAVTSVLNPELRDYHMDVAGMKHIAESPERPEMMMLGLAAEPGSQREELLKNNLEDSFPGREILTSGE